MSSTIEEDNAALFADILAEKSAEREREYREECDRVYQEQLEEEYNYLER